MNTSTLAPGTAEFTERLLERLRENTSIRGEPAVESIAASSRNTLIYRVRKGDTPLVCKADLGTRTTWMADEYQKLVELQERLAGTGARSLVPIAVYPDLGVLVTREEPGDTARRYIDRALAAGPGSEERRITEDLMDPCAEALFRFHVTFGLRRGDRAPERVVSYSDFHPGNLLVSPTDGELTIVMMDPPPKEKGRTAHWDIGTFCFGIARAGFTPYGVTRFSQNWLDELKARFIRGYFERLGRSVTDDDLQRIRASELARGARAIKRYTEFHRFPRWPVEFARMAFFSPIIGIYVIFHLRRSYRRIARLLGATPLGRTRTA